MKQSYAGFFIKTIKDTRTRSPMKVWKYVDLNNSDFLMYNLMPNNTNFLIQYLSSIVSF